jgi:predicted permease
MTLSSDALHALRNLRRRPAFTATAILSLVFGIGATSALFSVVDAVLLKPLPLPEADRLVVIEERKGTNPTGGNPARLSDWATQVPAFHGVAGVYTEGLVLTGAGAPESVETLRTVGRTLAAFGVRPALGRGFTPEEERGEGAPVVVLSHGYWQRRFGGDPGILGRTLALGGAARTVVGVLPRDLGFPEHALAWAPAAADVQQAPRTAGFLLVLARLAPGATVATAQSQVDLLALRLRAEHPESDGDLTARLVPLREREVRETRSPLLLLLGAAAFVLLIACVNVGGLLLSRGNERQREGAVRRALGAERFSLVRLFMAESVLLGLAGAILGLFAASWGVVLLKAVLPEDMPRLLAAEVDWRAAFFAAGLGLASSLLVGAIPAWQASRGTPGGLRDAGQVSIGLRQQRLRSALVVAEVALSAMLVTGAGLLARSFLGVQSQSLGFAPENTLTLSLAYPWDTPKQRLDRVYHAALESLGAIPGVRAVGLADRLPLQGGSQSRYLAAGGRELPPALANQEVSYRGASPGYFGAVGIPVRLGRVFAVRPTGSTVHEAVVNEALARAFFPGESALGQSLSARGEANALSYEIVGVVGDVRLESAAPVRPEVFVPMDDVYWPMASFVIRAAGEARDLLPAVRAAVQQVDPEQVAGRVATLEEGVGEAIAAPRLRALLVGGLALSALLLAATGLFGLLANDVAQRAPEIGIRMALGAEPEGLGRSAIGRGLGLGALGLALGLPAAVALGRVMQGLLFGVAAQDPRALAGAVLVTLGACALAAWVPARRAARLDPATILRRE